MINSFYVFLWCITYTYITCYTCESRNDIPLYCDFLTCKLASHWSIIHVIYLEKICNAILIWHYIFFQALSFPNITRSGKKKTCHEDIRGIWGIAPVILKLRTRWMYAVSFMPQLLYCWEKNPQFSLTRRLARPQSQSGNIGEKKNLLSLLEINPWLFSNIYFNILAQLHVFI